MNNLITIPAELTKNLFKFITFYLGLLFLSSFIIFFHQLYKLSKFNSNINFYDLFIPCITASIIGSCIYYIRKLYKLLLNEKFTFVSIKTKKCIGTFIYFFFRPLFAGIFALITLLGLNSGIFLLSSNLTSENLFYAYILISFLIGFSNGKFLTFIEQKSEKILKEF